MRVASLLALEGLDDPKNRAALRAALIFALLAMLLRAVFWLYTGRYWEDALITCLHSENFASGLGLTHHRPGEPPLHGFTSPLSVLVPLLGDLVHVGWGIEFLKLVSIPASALTVLYVLAFGIHPRVALPLPLTCLAMGYVAVEHHQILYGMAGMETQLATLVLAASIYYAVAWKPMRLGVTLGLCMLARPDFAFWALIVGVYGLVRDRRGLFLVVAVSVAVYAPWILFTTWYYGSPVPNTIIAKSLGYTPWHAFVDRITPRVLLDHAAWVLGERLNVTLGPGFAGHGPTHVPLFSPNRQSPIGNAVALCAAAGLASILLRRRWELWPLAACVIAYTVYYIYFVPIIFTWYKMPWGASVVLLAAVGLWAFAAWIRNPAVRKGLLWTMAAGYVGSLAIILPLTFHTERRIQRDIENPIRMAAGLYLRERMKPEEAVGCEPLGYMGYYSRGNVYDWPGLASRTVVAWSKAHPQARSLEGMLRGLQPEYLYLRDWEFLREFKDPRWLLENYHPVRAFTVDPDAAARIRWIETNVDLRFCIFKRNRPDDPKPYDFSIMPVDAIHVSRTYNEGLSFAARGDLRGAALLWEDVVLRDRRHADAFHNLLLAYLAVGDAEAARRTVALQRDAGLEPDPELLDRLDAIAAQ